MGGKSSTSTQSVSIPPEVLARYNSVNANAQQVAQTPFQQYSSSPDAFVAPLTSTQQAGIANTNSAAGQAQPYYQQATNGLYQAQGQAQPYYGAATDALQQGQLQGQYGTNQAYGSLYGGLGAAQPLQQAAAYNYGQAYSAAQPLQQQAGQNIANAQAVGSDLAGQSYNTMQQANDTAQPYQIAANSNYGQAYNNAQGYNQAAGQQYGAALQAAQPLQQGAVGQYYQGLGASQPLQQEAQGNIAGAQGVGAGLSAAAYGQMQGAVNNAQPLNQSALNQYAGGLGAAQPFQNAASQNYSGAQQIGGALSGAALGTLGSANDNVTPIQQAALQGYGQSYQGAQPFNAASAGQYMQGLGAAQPLQQQAQGNIAGAQNASQPYNMAATGLAAAGAGPVNAQQIGGQQIGQFMSPYIQSVLQGTEGVLNQQNQQAMSGQTGNAIMQGAFGGDRAGVVAANLQQQQNLANSQIYSNILNQGYSQALGAAQQQQGVNLGAGQANRAALQNASSQMLGIGQQGYSQGMGAASAQAALGQQQFGQNQAVAQGLGAVGNQMFNQGQTAAQNQAGLANQVFGQGATTAAQQAAIAQNLYGQGMGVGQAQQGLGQQMFGNAQTVGQNVAALGQQQFGQQAAQAAQSGQLSQQLYSQGMGAAQQQAALGQQQFGQNQAVAQGLGAMGSQVFGQQNQTGQNLAALGNQQYTQGMGLGQAQQGLGQQLFGQGQATAQQQAALGSQLFGQGTTAAQQQAALGNQLYTQGMGLGQAQQGLGQQVYGQGLSSSQQQAALGQQQFNQGNAASQQLQGLGQGLFGMGSSASQQLANLGSGAQAASLQGAQSQLAAGQVQQQTQQAGLQALYNQFLQQQSYPFQTAQFLANIAEGTGALSGQTTTTTQPGGFFSDERLKEDVRPIGKTNDGQTIYSYRYKGDHRTQMGLLAGEVEKKHPDAVGLAGGYKTVDYAKATADSARAKRYSGGLVGGFADGGMPIDYGQLLQAHEAMYGHGAGGVGGTPGMASYVPPVSGSVAHQLPTVGALPQQKSGLEQAKAIANLASSKPASAAFDMAKKSYHMATDPKEQADSAQEILDKNPDLVPNPMDAATLAARRGGRIARDEGGVVPQQMNIPDDQPGAKGLQQSAPVGPGRSGMDDVKDMAKIAMMVMAMKRGGRAGYALGGGPDDYDLDSIVANDTGGGELDGPSGILNNNVKVPAGRDKIADALRSAQHWAGGLSPEEARAANVGPEAASAALQRNIAPIASGLNQNLGRGLSKAPPPAPPVNTRAGMQDIWGDEPLSLASPPPAPTGGLAPQVHPHQSRQHAAATPAPAATQSAPPPTTAPAGLAGAQGPMPLSMPMNQLGTGDPDIGRPGGQKDMVLGSAAAGLAPNGGLVGAPAGSPPPAPGSGGHGIIDKAMGVIGDLGTGVENGVGNYAKALKGGDKATWLSLLSGLGAMGTAPTRSLGVALASGAKAGADTYMGAQTAEANRQKTIADIAKTQASTRNTDALTRNTDVDTQNAIMGQIIGQRWVVPDPNGDLKTQSGSYRVIGTAADLQAAKAKLNGGLGAFDGEAPYFAKLGDYGKQAAAQDLGITALQKINPGQVEQSNQIVSRVNADKAQAQDDRLNVNKYAQAFIGNGDHTPLAPGALTPFYLARASMINDLLDKIPVLKNVVGKVDPEQLTNDTIVQKLQDVVARARAGDSHNTTLESLQHALSATPGVGMDRNAGISMIADMYINAGKKEDRANYHDQWAQASSAVDGSYNAVNADKGFGMDHGSKEYLSDRTALMVALKRPEFQQAMGIINSAPPSDRNYAKALKWFDQFRPGLHRYFTGG